MEKGVTKINRSKTMSVKKFLFVEDGSVDLDELRERLESNPEIAVVVYRQGSMPPQLVKNK